MTASELRLRSFLKRIPPNAPSAVAKNIEAALKLSDHFQKKAAEVRSDAKLSAQDKREALLSVASKDFAEDLGQLQRECDRALAHIADETGCLQKRALDLLGDHVEQRVVENSFSARLKRLEVDRDAWENASAACTVAADEIAREVGITREGFRKLARPEAA